MASSSGEMTNLCQPRATAPKALIAASRISQLSFSTKGLNAKTTRGLIGFSVFTDNITERPRRDSRTTSVLPSALDGSSRPFSRDAKQLSKYSSTCTKPNFYYDIPELEESA